MCDTRFLFRLCTTRILISCELISIKSKTPGQRQIYNLTGAYDRSCRQSKNKNDPRNACNIRDLYDVPFGLNVDRRLRLLLLLIIRHPIPFSILIFPFFSFLNVKCKMLKNRFWSSLCPFTVQWSNNFWVSFGDFQVIYLRNIIFVQRVWQNYYFMTEDRKESILEWFSSFALWCKNSQLKETKEKVRSVKEERFKSKISHERCNHHNLNSDPSPQFFWKSRNLSILTSTLTDFYRLAEIVCPWELKQKIQSEINNNSRNAA